MSWNNVIPAWALGNPYGPVPSDGKYYYFIDEKQPRIGPFDSLEEAKKAMEQDANLR